jgi:cell division protein FtsI (penicillin-binding protein 3)
MGRNVLRRRLPAEPGPRRARMVVLSVLIGLSFIALLANAWYRQVERNAHYLNKSRNQHRQSVKLVAQRGEIHDRNGRELAVSAMVPSVYAIPSKLDDPGPLAQQLSTILEVDVAQLHRRLSRKNNFIWLKRHVTTAEADAVMALGNPALQLRQEPRRFYPNRGLAGALLGFAGIDGHGLEGIERDFDRYLRGKEYEFEGIRASGSRLSMSQGSLPPENLSGYTLKLTIDTRIQQVAEQALRTQIATMGAKGGVAIVMEPFTGDILAMAQSPVFDPNLFRSATPSDWRNRPVTDVLEPGSVIKAQLVAAAFDAGSIGPNTVLNGHNGRLKVGRKWVTDVHGQARLTPLVVVQKSSNVGAVQIGQRLGKESWFRYLRAFGFGEPTGVGFAGEQRGVLRPVKRWGLIHLATHSYGYGLSATPLQLVRAMAVIANGGNLVRVRVVQGVLDATGGHVETFPPRVIRRVIGAKSAAAATRGLIMVTEEGGTGLRARIPGYVVAGKTGTAHKVDPMVGGYSKSKVWASFSGFVPANHPKLVIYVAVDEPTEAHYGGVVAAPVFAQIAREVLPYLGIQATEPIDDVLIEGEDDWQYAAEGIDPQARPWWFEEAILAGAPSHLVVPDLEGQPISVVMAKARELDLNVEVRGTGLVTTQKPQAGALLPPHGHLVVSMTLPGMPPQKRGDR